MQSCEKDLFEKFFDKDSSGYHACLLEYGVFSKSSQGKRCTPLSWILNSDMFKSQVKNVFEEMSGILLEDGDRFQSPLMRSFLSVVQKVEQFNKLLLLEFLTEQAYVQGVLRKKLERTHLFFRRDPPTSKELDMYMENLQSALSAAPPACRTDVEQAVKSVVHANAMSLLKEGGDQDLFMKTYNHETGEEPSSYVLGDFNDFMENKSRLFEVYIHHKKLSYDFKFDEIVSAFTPLFGREITVYELRTLQRRILEGEETDAVLTRYKTNYRQMYDIFEGIFHEFLTRTPELFEFVREFADDILRDTSVLKDAVEFKEQVIDMVLNGEEYLTVTTNFVKQFFESIINPEDVAIATVDVRYFAHRLRKERLSVRDQSSMECMHQMFSEWTTQREEVEDLFKKILGRSSEREELAKFVEYYRWDDRRGVRTSIVITEELYVSLEYQDVIKAKIALLVPKLPRASLYNLMAIGIKSDVIRTLRSDDDVIAFAKGSNSSSDA